MGSKSDREGTEDDVYAASPNDDLMKARKSLVSDDFSRSMGVSAEPRAFPSVQSPDLMAVLIDGANLFYAASYLNIEIDYNRLLQALTQGRRLLRAYFYTGVDSRNEKQRGFLLWLSRHGYRVVSKELVAHPEGGRKANLHVEMAVDMLRLAKHCSTITVLSGDGHLTYALDALGRQGVTVEVVSLQSMTSDALIDLADRYIDLANLQSDIKKRRKV